MAWSLSSVTAPVVKVASPVLRYGKSAFSMLPVLPWYAWAGVAGAAGILLLSARAAGATEAEGGPAPGGGPERPTGPPPLLKTGATGPWVSYLQYKLAIDVTGTFDAATDAAVRNFQTANGLGVDGVVGAGTWGALGVTGSSPPTQGAGGSPQPAGPPPASPEPTTPAPSTSGNPFGLSDDRATREGQMLSHIADGNTSHQWWPLDYTTPDGHHVHVNVSRRAFALDNGTARTTISMTYPGTQKVADMIGGALLTTRISDEIFKAAKNGGKVVMNSAGVPPSQKWQGSGTDETGSDTKRIYDQSNFLEQKVGGASGLVANEGKDWVITRHFWQPPQGLGPTSAGKSLHNAANFGWYYDPPVAQSSHSPGGLSIIQSVGMTHNMNHVDYSQLLRFVQLGSLTIDGQSWDWAAALADPTVSKYIQDEGGTLVSPRHPDL